MSNRNAMRGEAAARPSIQRAISFAADPTAAAEELHAALWHPDCCLILLFISPGRDLEALAPALAHVFGSTRVAGCTTAGEIGPGGYATGSITGISLAGPDFAAAVGLIEQLQGANTADMQAVVRRTRLAIHDAAPWARHENLFAMTLIDGMCGCEELVITAAYGALAGIPIRGGSAGDGLRFERTFLLHEGTFRRDCALIIVVATTRRFRAFKTEHFVAGQEKTVVTGADPQRRIVTEINAEPAAREYARITGLDPRALTPAAFATHPMVVRVGDQSFVRAIRRVNADGSLAFLCAIDEGVVLTVARGVDLIRNLEEALDEIAADIGPPDLVIAFDCILRGLEMDQTHIRDQAGALVARHRAVGFLTYGEQYDAMHVNQTFTGIAIASAPPGSVENA
jgi:hypothetical protein